MLIGWIWIQVWPGTAYSIPLQVTVTRLDWKYLQFVLNIPDNDKMKEAQRTANHNSRTNLFQYEWEIPQTIESSPLTFS